MRFDVSFGFEQIAFLLTAVVTLAAALAMVFSRQVFHAILLMIAVFVGVATLYVLLGVSFMAGMQLFIYVGGVSVLAVIAIMVTRGFMGSDRPRPARTTYGAAIVAGSVFIGLAWLILRVPWPAVPLVVASANDLALLGQVLVSRAGFVVPFELSSLLLFVVLLGALYIARER